jgi:hypothetical protein
MTIVIGSKGEGKFIFWAFLKIKLFQFHPLIFDLLENDFHIFFLHFLSIGLSQSFYFLQFHPP